MQSERGKRSGVRAVLPGVLGILIIAGAAALAFRVVGGPEAPAPPDGQSLRRVSARYVCMVNDTVFDKEQIRVDVEGRTYYGCCAMCEKTLQRDPQSRTALDPISGSRVDKAASVIGARPDGTVYYFENEENLRRFASRSQRSRGGGSQPRRETKP